MLGAMEAENEGSNVDIIDTDPEIEIFIPITYLFQYCRQTQNQVHFSEWQYVSKDMTVRGLKDSYRVSNTEMKKQSPMQSI